MTDGDLQAPLTLRRRIYQILDHRTSTLTSRLVDGFLITIILLNVTAVVLETEAVLYETYRFWFDRFELVSVAVFTIEYLLRLWSCVENPRFRHPLIGRLRYTITPLALIDFCAILPFFVSSLLVPDDPLDLRLLRIFRLLRVLKLTRYSAALDLLLTVLREEASTLLSVAFLMLLVVLFAATGIYLIEHDEQPEAFGSILRAIWWAVVTLTTVGYGDVVPVTPWGKFFGLIITLAGIGMAAMPAGILASGFIEEMRRRREQFRSELRKALADGVISLAERENLEKMRHQLGLSLEEAQELLTKEKRRLGRHEVTCPHCHKRFEFTVEEDNHLAP